MSNPTQFFISESIALARSMPIKKAITYLNGLLLVAGDVQEVRDLRLVYINLCESDRQLELLQRTQIKMQFEDGKGAQ